MEVIEIDPSSNCLEIRYTAYYIGSKQYPEVHLKTLLIYYDNRGADIRDPDVFDKIVEEARRGLGDKYRNCKKRDSIILLPFLKKRSIRNLVNGND